MHVKIWVCASIMLLGLFTRSPIVKDDLYTHIDTLEDGEYSPPSAPKYASLPPDYIVITTPHNHQIVPANLDFSIADPGDIVEKIEVSINAGCFFEIDAVLPYSIPARAFESTHIGELEIAFRFYFMASGLKFAQLIVIRDTTFPDLRVYSPEINSVFGTRPPEYMISAHDENLVEFGIITPTQGKVPIQSLFDPTSTPLIKMGVIPDAVWSSFPAFETNLTFYARDAAGHVSNASVPIFIDRIPPEMSVTFPVNESYHGSTPPFYSLEVFEPNLKALYYELGGRQYPITTTSGEIDAAGWDAITDARVEIRFVGIDKAGNQATIRLILYREQPVSSQGFTDYIGLFLNLPFELQFFYSSIIIGVVFWVAMPKASRFSREFFQEIFPKRRE